ncbi:MAG TPA: 16S rRNA (cytosine(1402)-N(4))-methyltransferase RsmH, partial [Bacillota bacterium]|nr:16S rRNA (cytosine(1402)-N(4))-methyltransferase RsmH [Bacillota bacterium]
LEAVGDKGRVIAMDVDESAAKTAMSLSRIYPPRRFTFVQLNFRNLDVALHMAGGGRVDAVFFDLGVSSPQFDEAGRGFSYWHDAPLDMRMSLSQSVTAADIINNYDEDRLTTILHNYGEERWARRIAKFLVAARASKAITTTGQLVEIIRAAVPKDVRTAETQHPARRTFQALRIAVNEELEALETALGKALHVIRPGGRLACISFHSLEDRIVKRFIANQAQRCTCPPGIPQCVCTTTPTLIAERRKPILPTQDEITANPRARSAKLRVATRL